MECLLIARHYIKPLYLYYLMNPYTNSMRCTYYAHFTDVETEKKKGGLIMHPKLHTSLAIFPL